MMRDGDINSHSAGRGAWGASGGFIQHSTFCRGKKLSAGFTLLEMIVSIGVFSVVMLIAVGSILAVVGASTKAQAQKSVINNVNFAIEAMARELRVGTSYNCGGVAGGDTPRDCVSGGTELAFEASDGDPGVSGDQTRYRFNAADASIERSTDNGTTYRSITATDITIKRLDFFVTGAPPEDGLQPRVLIVVDGVAGRTERVRSEFHIETLVSQRLLDS